MGYNYYNANGKKTGYSAKDSFGNRCRYGADGKKQGYYGKDIWGNDCFISRNGNKTYKKKSWW